MCLSVNPTVWRDFHAWMKKPTASKLGTVILTRIFEKILKWVFQNFIKIFFSFHWFLHMCELLEAYIYEIWCRDTKEGYWADLEAIFSKIFFFIIYRNNFKSIIFVWAINHVKNWSIDMKLGNAFPVIPFFVH